MHGSTKRRRRTNGSWRRWSTWPQKLTSRLDFSSVLDTVATAAAEVFGADVGFRLIDGDELLLNSATPGARAELARQRLKIGESISGRVAACADPTATTTVPA